MELKEIETSRITVLENIRQKYADDDLADLMQSIKNNGLLQPVGLQHTKSNEYILIWGFRRLQAFRKLGYKTIPAVIFINEGEALTEEDFLILNASENIHRRQITTVEIGRVCMILRNKGFSFSEIAAKLNISKSRVKLGIEQFQQLPEKYRNKVVIFGAAHQNKNGSIASTSSSVILRMRRITKDEREQIFDWVAREEKTNEEITVLSILLKEGISLKEALKIVGKYKSSAIKLAVNEEKYKLVLRNYKSWTDFVKQTLNKSVPGLVFDSRDILL